MNSPTSYPRSASPHACTTSPQPPRAGSRRPRRCPPPRAALADIEQRILDGAEQRAALTADLEAALERAGHQPTAPLVQALRRLEQ